ncbi:MAG: hypothetical protein ACM31C_25420 [Acidobacteriota bacterium]
MRSPVLCALVAIGCGSSGSGVDVEVKAPSGTRTVELLVAPGDCTDATCSDGIAWTIAGPQAAGTIYKVDSDTRNTLQVPASGTVRFRLHSNADQTIDRLAAIGFDAAGAPLSIKVLHDIVVPTDHAEIWQLSLDAIDEIGDQPDAPPASGTPTERQHVWRAPVVQGGPEDPASYPSCVVTQSWSDSDSSWDRHFIVPSDHDCDNQAIECNANWYDFAAGQTASVCATNNSGTFAPACIVGGSLCADGRSSSTACAADPSHPPLCIPDAMCQCTDPGTFDTCVRDELAAGFTAPMQSPVTFANCDFPSVTGTAGSAGPCQSNSANRLVIDMPSSCTAVTLYRFGVPGAMMVAMNDSSFTLNNNQSFQMQVTLGDGGGCPIALVWQSGTASLAATPLLLDVAYGTNVHLLMPVRIAYVPSPTCPPVTQTPNCPLVGAGANDHMFTCIK